MNKKEAVERMVDSFSSLSQEQFRTLAEASGEYFPLPMWGTLWRMDYFGETLYDNARYMLGDKNELRDEAEACKDKEERKKLLKAIKDDDWSVLEEYIDEEMSGARNILDKDGNTTAMFIYELDGEYWLGVHGAGWDFYKGVWDKLYDICGLEWHDNDNQHETLRNSKL